MPILVLYCLHYRWFTHFYVWGVIWNYTLFSVFTLKCIFHSNSPISIIDSTINTLTGGLLHRECTEVSQHHFNVFIVLLLLCVQVSRRLYECLYVSVFSTSRMHIVHYLLGLYFYTAVGPTALLHLNSGVIIESFLAYLHSSITYPYPLSSIIGRLSPCNRQVPFPNSDCPTVLEVVPYLGHRTLSLGQLPPA